jgi:hypothetical protein
MWYWDGARWKPTTSGDGKWRWDGYDWIPLRGRYTTVPRSRREPSFLLLVGLLMLDLIGFVPGGWIASAAAAVALLVIDGRGLVTLNGLIKWRRMSFRLTLLAVFLGIVLFQFVVAAYIVLRLIGMAKTARRPVTVVHRSSPIKLHVATMDTPDDAGPRDPNVMRSALEGLTARAKSQLPPALLEKLRAVVAAIVDILPAYAASDLTAHDRFVVEHTVDDYLPSAVNTYLKLPVAYRSLPLRDAEGRTADELLAEELDLLLQRMSEVADVAYRKDVEALLIHGRFLRSKFGPSRLTLKT